LAILVKPHKDCQRLSPISAWILEKRERELEEEEERRTRTAKQHSQRRRRRRAARVCVCVCVCVVGARAQRGLVGAPATRPAPPPPPTTTSADRCLSLSSPLDLEGFPCPHPHPHTLLKMMDKQKMSVRSACKKLRSNPTALNNLKELSFNGAVPTNKDLAELAELLALNTSVEKLDLSNARLDNESAKIIGFFSLSFCEKYISKKKSNF